MQTKNLECWRAMWRKKNSQGSKIKVWRHARQREVKWKKYLKEADVPLVGCFANDTENRFTAGIANNSEEIKKKNSLVLLSSSHRFLYIMFSHSVAFLMWTLVINCFFSFGPWPWMQHWLTDSCIADQMFEDTDEAKHGKTSTDECEVEKILDRGDEGRENKKKIKKNGHK